MNTPIQGEEATRLKRQGADQAIQLALESKWEEAVVLNRAILSVFAGDVDAWNRLGKALSELGRYREALEAYSKSLELEPGNSIAKRNIERLSTISESEQPRRVEATAKVAQDLFIEEIGKTGVTVLQGTSREALATLTSGDEVYLKPGDELIRVENAAGQTLGSLEPKLALRLLRLMEGGSRYAAAVKSVNENEAEIIIKEIYRDPNQTRPSFPTTAAEGVRPYIKESLLRLAEEEEEELEEEIDSDEWEGESEPSEAAAGFSGFPTALDRDVVVDVEEDEEE